MEQIAAVESQWSTAVEEGDWIAERLAPFEACLVASVIPPGFEAYARLLHPVRAMLAKGARTVRWREIAAWSGVPLQPDSQFHSIAMPETAPPGPPPWKGQGPERGSLDMADAHVLLELLAPRTRTPGDCRFCLWDGWGWDSAMYVAVPGEPMMPAPDPVPPEVRYGPRVQLPGRDYLLYTGPIDAALAFAGSTGQTPNLWWPADRAWCVASEIDLSWSYVGGSASLIAEVLADPRLEALPAALGQPHSWVEGYVVALAEQGVSDLMQAGKTSIDTTRGSIKATLRGPGRLGRSGLLRIQSDTSSGVGARNDHRLTAEGDSDLAAELSGYLTLALTGLVED